MNRGLAVVESVKILKGENPLTPQDLDLAIVLGWCIEIVWRVKCMGSESGLCINRCKPASWLPTT